MLEPNIISIEPTSIPVIILYQYIPLSYKNIFLYAARTDTTRKNVPVILTITSLNVNARV